MTSTQGVGGPNVAGATTGTYAKTGGGGGPAIQPESGLSGIKISAFPNAATPMGSGDVVTGLQGGANVNFSQAQIRGPLPFFGSAGAWSRPSLATFSTWLNQTPEGGLSAATATDNPNGLPLVIQAHEDSIPNPCITGLLKTIGSPPWTITAGMAAFTSVNTAGTPVSNVNATWFYPIILYDDTKAIAFSWYSNSGAVAVTHFDDVVPQSGNYSTPLAGNAHVGFAFPDYFEWFRISNDGTTLTYSISPDGLLFFDVYSEAASYLSTISHVGFGFDHYIPTVTPLAPADELASLLWFWNES